MEMFWRFVSELNGIVWGWPLISLLLATGVFLSVGLRFYTLFNIPRAIRLLIDGRKSTGEGEITPFQALTTALSATIGNGNIVGVALAITLGGPGAIFWMWIVALFGMATKFSEAVLAVEYREKDENGVYRGGPMYYIKNGMGKRWHWLGWLFAATAMLAAFGMGNMFQAEVVASVVAGPLMGFTSGSEEHETTMLITGVVLAVMTYLVIIGNVQRIGKIASFLMPFMAAAYVLVGLVVIGLNADAIPAALSAIFHDAFNGTAAAGGFTGAVFAQVISMGLARGIFSNESGLGSAAIAHAAAQTNDPVRQGTIAMLGTFIDTIIVCTITALAILTVSLPVNETVVPAWQTGVEASVLTATVFGTAIPFGAVIVSVCSILFAYSTMISWSYYGESSARFLFGNWVGKPYKVLWVLAIVLGTTTLNLEDIRLVSDTMNGMMAVPNLIALLALSGVVFRLTRMK
jgi:alanine or glycine:cation symporter, AGCS family